MCEVRTPWKEIPMNSNTNITRKVGSRRFVRSGLVLVVGLATFAVAAPPALAATLSFDPPRYNTTGIEPTDVVAVDADRDGHLDLVVENTQSDNVSVLRGDGSGSFAAPVNIPTVGKATKLEVKDLDADGRVDLVMAIREPAAYRRVAIMRGNALGSFDPPLFVSAGPRPHAVAVADLNGDGDPDLVTGHCCGLVHDGNNFVSVMLAGPGLTFASPVNYSTGGTISFDLELVDLNGDGFLDIATSLQYSAAVAILLGDGAGGFSSARLVGFADGVQGFAVADVDGDGDSDLTVANGLSSLAVARNTSSGAALTFATPVTVPLSSPALGLSGADVNGDGVADVVASHLSADVVSVMLGARLGNFSIAGPFAAGASPYRSAVADVDEDGSADIVVVNDRAYPAVGGVSVLLNASAPLDTDGDGIVDDVDNCVSVANASQADADNDGSGDSCDTDLDGDGVTNTTDNCPTIANPTQVDTDKDGIGDTCDTDLDGDGVTNTTDNCPTIANPTQVDTDKDGRGDACDQYTFGGFRHPIDNPPIVNVGNTGRTYPVKFQVRDAKGNVVGNVSAVTSIKYVSCGCSTSDPRDAIETTVTGSTGLRFAGDEFIYNWKTPAAQGCYRLTVTLADGGSHYAIFSMKY
jgi:hypothetical protein